MSAYSVNASAVGLVDALVENAAALRLQVQQIVNGWRIIDAGIACHGGVEAGRLIAEICPGGLGYVSLTPTGPIEDWAANAQIHTDDPVSASLGWQYAGWSPSHGAGKSAFLALGSAPGRVLAREEALYRDPSSTGTGARATLVLEVDQLPPPGLSGRTAEDCGVTAEKLTLILTPTSSLAGATEVVARALEVAMHEAHELHFPLAAIVGGLGAAPLPPPAPDFLNATGRTNDAILFGGQVHLYVNGSVEAAQALTEQLPAERRATARRLRATRGGVRLCFFVCFSPGSDGSSRRVSPRLGQHAAGGRVARARRACRRRSEHELRRGRFDARW